MKCPLSQEEISLILDRLGDFKDQQGDFEEFLDVVNTDIETKTEYWRSLKTSAKSNETGAGKNFRTYVAIQVFMLRRYARRIARFQKSTKESTKRICMVHTSTAEGEEVQHLVDTHLHILVKMKRRLKHMMDVSDKYFLVDLVDTLSYLGKATSRLDPTLATSNCTSRSSCSSIPSLDLADGSQLSLAFSYLSLSSASLAHSSSPLPSSHRPRLRSFRSLVDQLVVLSKTYTERGE